MEAQIQVQMPRQPDNVTCGPTCLYALYRYCGDEIGLDEVIAEVPRLDDGGTLAVLLGCHALRRGYTARIYTCNLQVFDPTWFLPGVDVRARLEAQRSVKAHKRKLRVATEAYLEFLDRGARSACVTSPPGSYADICGAAFRS